MISQPSMHYLDPVPVASTLATSSVVNMNIRLERVLLVMSVCLSVTMLAATYYIENKVPLGSL